MKTIKKFLGGVKRAITNPAEYRKAYAFLTTVPAEIIAVGLLHGSALHWANVIIPIITTALGAAIANADREASPNAGPQNVTTTPQSAPTGTETTYERIDQSPTDSSGSVA